MGFFSDIRKDYRAVFDRDPAARSAIEVLLLNSGLHALFFHRTAHLLHGMHIPFLPAALSVATRLISGIEIHPAATLGGGFFIDHGTGVVIGETAEAGTDCLIYQGVTLGGTGKEKGKRHPTLGNGVVVGAGAKILGAITIGDYAKIGANAVVLKDVPRDASVVGVPGRVVRKKVYRVEEGGPIEVLDHVHMPDPIEEKFKVLEGYIIALEKKIQKLEGKKTTMKIYNTQTGRKEEFETLEPGKVGMYACGITVYDNCHIGHARSAIVFDVIRQYLTYRGYKVKFIKNFTDIDDKIINRANERGVTWDEIATKYTQKYHGDMTRLGVRPADVEPKATEHIPEILEIVEGLVDKGFAYVVDGDVYFEVNKFEGYGKLSGRKLEDMRAGARVAVDGRKRSPMDFALWKSSKEGEPSWDSPWGAGRPGWHIECSAMSLKHLGKTFDIHGGGADLTFPHHENELTQSEAFTGQPFVKYWVHNGFITVDKEKMSKSLGNFFTIKDILAQFDPEVVRMFLLNAHYRSPIEFSDEQLRETEKAVARFYLTLGRVDDFLALPVGKKDKGKDATDALHEFNKTFESKFSDAMDDDFNTAMSIGHMHEMVHEINRFLDSKVGGQSAVDALRSGLGSLKKVGAVLNIFQRSTHQWNISVMKYKTPDVSVDDIEQVMAKRNEARQAKDWDEADRLRKELEGKGIVLEDKPGGLTAWRVKL